MRSHTPATAEELADLLRDAAGSGHVIALDGAGSKSRAAGPPPAADVHVSTRGLRRVLLYEPRDLTISVEAGMPFAELQSLLAADRQMIALDPPFASATVGGIVAANSSGPMRRFYGAPRDLVIGMRFAMLDGKIAQSGGMVVKNVAGLDTGKLMIGSFGTLAAIVSVNFKVLPQPEGFRAFVRSFATLAEAIAERDRILAGVLQPLAVDLVNPAAAAALGLERFCLLLRAGGTEAVLNRYQRDLAGFDSLDGEAELSLWDKVRHFIPTHLGAGPASAAVRISCRLSALAPVLSLSDAPAIARAGNGVTYFCLPSGALACALASHAAELGFKSVVDFGPEPRDAAPLWPAPGPDLTIMEKVKGLFDPGRLLNPGRLYGRI